jgi:hypothetical protein
MPFAKSAALFVLATVLGSGVSQAAAMSATSWRWTSWPSQSNVAALRWGTLPPPPTSMRTAGQLMSTAPTAAPAPASWTFVASAPAAPASAVAPADAFINLGDGPFSRAGTLTTGDAQPWYLSSVVQKLYGGTPSAEQRVEFARQVVDRVEAAYQRSGLRVDLTSDPSRPAAHTLSVVSNAQSPASPTAVGVTDVGRDGFTFVDKFPYAKSVDELEQVIAGNVAHELAHAFGSDYHDPTSGYLDSAVADWSTLASGSSVFSPETVRRLSTRSFQDVGTGSILGAQQMHGPNCPDCQQIAAQFGAAPVPEPATWMAWGLLLAWGSLIARRRSLRRAV